MGWMLGQGKKGRLGMSWRRGLSPAFPSNNTGAGEVTKEGSRVQRGSGAAAVGVPLSANKVGSRGATKLYSAVVDVLSFISPSHELVK